MLLQREIIHYFCLKYRGNWDEILERIKQKEKVDEDEYRLLSKDKSKYITLLDDNYPDCLKRIFRPPFALFYYGDISLLKSKIRLSSIGTRNPTKYQYNYTYKLIKEVEEQLKSKVTIISGLAKGIDLISMKGAKDTNSPIIGVLGNGIDIIYPSESKEIYEYCKSGKGLLISEYPGNTTPDSSSFIKRNRIIASLSEVLFVGGGKNKSGSSTTVRFALENNKEIMALPCNNTGDDLTNALISEGAEPVLNSQDIVKRLQETYNFS